MYICSFPFSTSSVFSIIYLVQQSLHNQYIEFKSVLLNNFRVILMFSIIIYYRIFCCIAVSLFKIMFYLICVVLNNHSENCRVVYINNTNRQHREGYSKCSVWPNNADTTAIPVVSDSKRYHYCGVRFHWFKAKLSLSQHDRPSNFKCCC